MKVQAIEKTFFGENFDNSCRKRKSFLLFAENIRIFAKIIIVMTFFVNDMGLKRKNLSNFHRSFILWRETGEQRGELYALKWSCG